MSAELDKNDLPQLPENEKTYAGIPEAIFVVSRNIFHFYFLFVKRETMRLRLTSKCKM